MNTKEIILALFTIALGFANASLWHDFIASGSFGRASLYSLPVIATFAFAILFALSAIFIRKKLMRNATAILAIALGYLFVPYTSGVIIMAAASALAAWYACEAIANEYQTSHSFSVRKSLRGGLPMFLTAVVLLLTMFYFSSAANQTGNVLLPKTLFNATIPLLEKPIQGIIPGFRSGISIDQLILTFASKQSGGSIDISELPQAQQEEFIREGRRALGEQLGVPLTGKERSEDVLYEAANVQVGKLAGPYRQYLPLLGAVGFFLAVKTLTLPMYWITLLLVFLMVKLLITMGILKKEISTIEVERITL